MKKMKRSISVLCSFLMVCALLGSSVVNVYAASTETQPAAGSTAEPAPPAEAPPVDSSSTAEVGSAPPSTGSGESQA